MSPWVGLGAALLSAAALGGSYWQGRQDGRALERDKVTAERNAATIQRDKALRERDELADKLRQADDVHTSQLQKARDETTALRDRSAAGAVRLRVAAFCLDQRPAVPEAPAASGVDPGAGAELDTAARSAYFALRDGIDAVQGKLAACQDQLAQRSH